MEIIDREKLASLPESVIQEVEQLEGRILVLEHLKKQAMESLPSWARNHISHLEYLNKEYLRMMNERN